MEIKNLNYHFDSTLDYKLFFQDQEITKLKTIPTGKHQPNLPEHTPNLDNFFANIHQGSKAGTYDKNLSSSVPNLDNETFSISEYKGVVSRPSFSDTDSVESFSHNRYLPVNEDFFYNNESSFHSYSPDEAARSSAYVTNKLHFSSASQEPADDIQVKLILEENASPTASLPITENLTLESLAESLAASNEVEVQTSTDMRDENNDLPVIAGAAAGLVSEEGAALLTTGGRLTISDEDTGEAAFIAQENVAGAYGRFSMNAEGEWSYSADNSQEAIQRLPANGSLTETFTVKSVDGTPQTITVTIKGTNDLPVIAGATAGLVSEEGAALLTTGGHLTISDVDTGEAAFIAQENVAGTYGRFSMDAEGEWSYSADNSQEAIQRLPANGSLTETFTVKTIDGTNQTITVTIKGTNDLPVIAGAAAGLVSEEGAALLTTGGRLTISDVDTGEAAFIAQENVAGTYGRFSMDAEGEWSYSADNSQEAIQRLPANGSLTETFTVKTIDGTNQTITVTIKGTNDLPVIAGATAGLVSEEGAALLTTGGRLTISDVDTGEAAFIAQENVAGTYGRFSVDAEGEWSYSADNSQAAIQRLPANGSLTETFTVKTIDGTNQTITVTIKGTNDLPVIAGATAGLVSEEGAALLTTGGRLTISDVDTGEAAFIAQENVAGTYGRFSVDAEGEWSYSADNSQAAIQRLPANGSLTETFTVKTIDGTNQTITVTIKGTNDLPVIAGATAGLVSEEGAALLTTGGRLTISDVDTGEAAFIAQENVAGTYGRFSMDAEGEWSYSADNSQAAIQRLPANGSLTETFTVKTIDGTNQTITVTIKGTNDLPVIAGATAGLVSEEGAALLTTGGRLTISDVDTGEAAFIAQENVAGTYGRFSVDAEGEWSYSADNSQAAIQRLPANGSLTETFTVKTIDGTNQTITVTIKGTNDLPVIAGATAGLVSEEGAALLTTGGRLTISDVDTGEAAFIAQENVAGTYGRFSMDAEGEWSYSADNSQAAIQRLPANGSLTETFTVKTIDGTNQTITVTIKGTNDLPVIAGATAGLVSEEGAALLTTGGRLTISDVDTGEAAFIAQENVAGTYGRFSMDAEGEWSYSADNSQEAIQRLPANGSLTEIFTVKTIDGTNQTITVTIKGTNDLPVIAGATAGLVSEEGAALLTTGGRLTISDVDTGEAAFIAQENVAGTYGRFSMDAEGEWSYSADNSQEAIQRLPANGSLTEIFTVKTIDGTNQTITVTIKGTNDLPVIAGATAGLVSEEGAALLTTGGRLTISDEDTGEAAFIAQENVAGTYGRFSVDAEGEWSYSADNSQAAIQRLPANGSLTETFTVKTIDGTNQTITVTIKGTNDLPVIAGAAAGLVSEEGAALLTTGGRLTISDVDTGEAAFIAQENVAGTYGRFSMDAEGEWSYSADNSQEAIQRLPANGSLTEIFTVKTIDGTNQTITVTIKGTNDLPVIAGATAGLVSEEGAALLTTGGRLTISDVDTGEAAFIAQENVAGTYGRFSVDAEGEWSYSADNSQAAIQRLPANGSLTEIFTVKSVDGTNQTITVTIKGTNDLPVIAGATAGLVSEEGAALLTTGGRLTISDVDTGEAAFIAQENVAGTYGRFSMDAEGEWSYSADNSQAAIQSLPANGSLTEIFTVKTIDGTNQTITVTIKGTNDLPVIAGATAGLVSEEGAALLTTGGRLTISDVDTGEAAFIAQENVAGTYGRFSVDAEGEWSYSADNSQAAIQRLPANGSLTETFTVKTIDGTNQTITVTIKGTNDLPVIAGATAGLVSEEGAALLTTGGRLTISDVDTGEAAFIAQENVAGTYGRFSMDAEGEWSYSADNSQEAIQRLPANGSLTETFTVKSVDGTNQTITVTIKGTNDLPVIAGATAGLVSEEGAALLTTGGRLTISDVDTGEAAFIAQENVAGTYGRFSMDAEGEWSYSADNSQEAIQRLPANGSLTETFTVKSVDGTNQTITVTIKGTNDLPVIAGATAGLVSEEGAALLTTGGRLTISDVDTGEAAFIAQENVAGTYGRFSMDAEGEWSYSADNSQEAIQRLPANGSLTETFTVKSVDGTNQTITVTIKGTNDLPVIAGAAAGLVSEEGAALLTTGGRLTISDVDTGEAAFIAQENVAGTYGRFSMDAEGEWSYSADNSQEAIQRLPANGSLTETFTVKTVDGTNQNVVITIKGTNDLPIATADVVSLNAAQSVSGNLFSNDRDVDIGDQLNLAWINNSNNSTSIGAWGQLTWEPDGSFTYTVNPDATAYLGAGKSVSETFEYAVSDQYGGLTTSTLTISNIVGVNDNPVATASVLRLGEGQNILGQLYATDADSNHGMDSLSFNVVTGTAHGQLILNTDGSFSYTANPGYYGTDSFTYKVIDPLGGTSNTATVAINIHERRFEFTPANEALVNTTTNSNQSDPVVTALSGGGYVVAWEGRGASDTTGVYGQIYNDAGSKIGSEFRINSSTSGNQQNVSVATTSSGFIATWDSASGALDSSGTGVYARVFNSNGVGGSEFRINQSTSGNQQNSQVIVLDDGKIAVVWESVESGAPNIYARFFNSSGTALTNEIRINTNLSNNQQRPSISQVGDKVVITWEDNANSSNGYDIKAQLISIDSSSLGGFIGSNFIVNTIVGSNQNNPEVTVLENGNFVVTYESTVGSSKEIYLKQFDADGVAVGVETRINTTTTGNQDNVAVTALRSGGYMVVWSSVESGSDKYGVFAQEFNADGSKAGDEFRINVHNANDQNLPTLTELTDGSIVIAWQSQNQAAGWDIYHSLLKDMAQGGMFMEGSSSNDTLRGTESSDIISGGAGDDILIGGGAADYLSGGTGMDTADYSYSLAGVKVNLSSGSNTGGDATGDILSGIENIRGSKYADILEGNSGYNTLWGGEGNDQLIGGAGDDVLLGGSGSNILSGGTGVDTASYEDSASGVTVNLTTGTSSMGDSLQDVENIKGSSFGDTLIGDRSDNILEGGAGEDSLLGGEGSDTASYTGSTMGVSVNLSTGIGSGGEAHGDTFTSIENITGSKYSDTLLGDTNANTLSGGAGNDTLMGGAGNDLFTFGLNSDSDVLYGGTDTQDGGSWVDTVQLTDATTGPANSIEARGDWLLQTEATYTIVDKAVTFTEGNASGTITLADGSMATFTDIDQIRWS